ncbi:MAG: sulfatase [Pirellulaceae bacterium]
MRRFIWLISAIWLGSLFLEANAAAETPNMVLIISDDQAWTDYGFMGHEAIRTPNIDKLASQSATFVRGYVPTSLCRPSLMTLVTGLYAHQHKTSGNDPSSNKTNPQFVDKNDSQLRASLIAHIDRYPTVPTRLGKRGYLSHQSGKWWEGHFKRGGFTHGMTRGFPQPGGRHGDDGLKIGRDGMEPVFEFVDMAVEEEKPFFLWYAPFLPHSPHNPPGRILKKYRQEGRPETIAKYYAMCDWFDETCGQLLDYMDAKGIRDNTLVVFVADNGWIQNPNGRGFAPRSKQSAYEGGTRTPILFRWPGVIPPGQRDALCSSIDIAPTILGAGGAEIPEELPGVNLLPVLRDGKPLDRKALFGEGFAHDIADIENPEESLLYRWVIEGKWKLLLTYDGRLGRYARVHPREEKRPQLFDLMADPHEKQNLAAEHPEVVARLARQIADAWPVTERQVQTEWTD